MAEQINLRVVYDGTGPVHWSGGPGDFGLQDEAALLHRGTAAADGRIAFDLSLAVKPATDAPVFVGRFAHGPPARRFLYLGWRNRSGEFAQRLKLPLGTIGWDAVREAVATGAPLVATVVDHHPKATTTGANIGGTRAVVWQVETVSGAARDRRARIIGGRNA